MNHAVANGIDSALSSIATAMTVLDAAMEQAARDEGVKPESATDHMWQQEIHHLYELMVAAYILMQRPVQSLEDIKDTAWRLAKEAKEEDPH